jgi:hypothetical protein
VSENPGSGLAIGLAGTGGSLGVPGVGLEIGDAGLVPRSVKRATDTLLFGKAEASFDISAALEATTGCIVGVGVGGGGAGGVRKVALVPFEGGNIEEEILGVCHVQQ